MKKYLTLILLLLPIFTACQTVKHTTILPSYVVINDPKNPHKEVLRKPAGEVSFPLSQENLDIIAMLGKKFDEEDNCAGLAAPQIGFNRRIIIFAAHDDPELKKWRPDLTDTMERTIWINPTYETVNDDMHEDFESCFSVNNLAGPVKRYKSIRYHAFTPEGKPVSGVANGFLARIIQHEIDHLNGLLFIDLVPKEKLISLPTP